MANRKQVANDDSTKPQVSAPTRNAWGSVVNRKLRDKFVGDEDLPMVAANDVFRDMPYGTRTLM